MCLCYKKNMDRYLAIYHTIINWPALVWMAQLRNAAFKKDSDPIVYIAFAAYCTLMVPYMIFSIVVTGPTLVAGLLANNTWKKVAPWTTAMRRVDSLNSQLKQFRVDEDPWEV